MRIAWVIGSLLGIVLCQPVTGQSIDTYRRGLAQQATRPGLSPPQRIEACIQVVDSYRFADSAKSLRWAEKAMAVAQQHRLPAWQSLVYAHRAWVYSANGDEPQQRLAAQYAFDWATKSQNNQALGYAYYEKAMLEPNQARQINYFLIGESYLLKTPDNVKLAQLYYQLSGYYAYVNDSGKRFLYAQKSLEAAHRQPSPYAHVLAYFAMGDAYQERFQQNKQQQASFDSAMFYYRQALMLENHHELARSPLVADVYHNIAALYWDKDSRLYADSILHITRQTIDRLATTPKNSTLLMARCLRSDVLLMQGRVAEAAQLIQQAVDGQPELLKDQFIRSRLLTAHYLLYKKQRNYPLALATYEQLTQLQDSINNVNRVKEIKRIEARFINARNIARLQTAEEKVLFRTGIAVGLLALLGVSVFALVLRTRLARTARQQFVLQENLLRQQLTEQELQATLQQKEVERLLLENQLEQQQKEYYQQDLMGSLLQIERKNDLLLRLKTEIKALPAYPSRLLTILDQTLSVDDDFKKFNRNFERSYPSFLITLQQQADNQLTQLDLKYCAYIKLGMSTKEVAALLSIEPQSVRMSKYRIKQKFRLSANESLDDFIRQGGAGFTRQ